jgi:hypothetical protein
VQNCLLAVFGPSAAPSDLACFDISVHRSTVGKQLVSQAGMQSVV